MKKIIVIGSGFGGLSIASRLRSRGFDATILEKQPDLGGRARTFVHNGYKYDAGPTVITAPNLFYELFELFGESLEDHLEFKPLSTWYRFHFNDQTEFDYGSDREKMLSQIEELSPEDVSGYLDMLKESKEIFNAAHLIVLPGCIDTQMHFHLVLFHQH